MKESEGGEIGIYVNRVEHRYICQSGFDLQSILVCRKLDGDYRAQPAHEMMESSHGIFLDFGLDIRIELLDGLEQEVLQMGGMVYDDVPIDKQVLIGTKKPLVVVRLRISIDDNPTDQC
jgi:hypothetical protein